MKKKYSHWLKSAILMGLGLLLVACSNGNSEGNSTAQDTEDGQPVEITFWHAMVDEPEEELQALTDKFNQSQDQYHVTLQNQGNYEGLAQKVMASGVADSLPTISQATATEIPDWTNNHLITPLDDLLTPENGFEKETLDGLYPGFISSVQFNDQLMALPFAKSDRVMYVNEDILEEYDAEVPTTWDEVQALGEKMKDAGDERYAMGFETVLDVEVQTMARQNGAEWISKDLQTVDLGGEKATEPFELLMKGFDERWIRNAGEDDYVTVPFGRGEAALSIGSSAGASFIDSLAQENGMNWTYAELPTFGDGEPLTLLSGSDVVLFDNTTEEEKKGALTYLNFLLSPENNAEWAIQTGYLPVTEESQATDAYQQFVEENPRAKAPIDSLEHADGQALFVGSGEYLNAWQRAQDNIVLEHQDVKETMSELQDEIKALIEENN